MLLDEMPFRTRVKKEGKRMSFIFQFSIVAHGSCFGQAKKGSFGREALAGFGRENLKAGGAVTCCFIW